MAEPIVIQTVRCPSCGALPAALMDFSQVFCGTDFQYCRGSTFSMLTSVEDQLRAASVHNTDDGTTTIMNLLDPEALPDQLTRPAMPQPDPLQDAHDEAEVREALHELGATCAADCPICDPWLKLTPAQRGDIELYVDSLSLPDLPRGGAKRVVKSLYGVQGEVYAEALLRKRGFGA